MTQCKHFGTCGGCSYLDIPYPQELAQKEATLRETLTPYAHLLENITPAPNQKGYRNKMELAFGDQGKDSVHTLALGIRKRRSFYEVATVESCELIPEDFRTIALHVQSYFREAGEAFFHRKRHTGTLRHLVLRRGEFTGEILICLSTTSKLETELAPLITQLQALPLNGKIVGILHSINDGVADVVRDNDIHILWGQDHFRERLAISPKIGLQTAPEMHQEPGTPGLLQPVSNRNAYNLDFTVSAFSFFQTNSAGAEVLYGIINDMATQATKSASLAYDLYCGTGTIAQVLSPSFDKVIGIELNPSAIAAAQENARLNGITNCEFFAGDVQEVIDNWQTTPDVVIVDPPRNGLHPKALAKLIALSPPNLVYVACKPESLARDMALLVEAGYKPIRAAAVDMFPRTPHMEAIMLLRKC